MAMMPRMKLPHQLEAGFVTGTGPEVPLCERCEKARSVEGKSGPSGLSARRRRWALRPEALPHVGHRLPVWRLLGRAVAVVRASASEPRARRTPRAAPALAGGEAGRVPASTHRTATSLAGRRGARTWGTVDDPAPFPPDGAQQPAPAALPCAHPLVADRRAAGRRRGSARLSCGAWRAATRVDEGARRPLPSERATRRVGLGTQLPLWEAA